MIPHTCSAKIGARGCQHPREEGRLFCLRHLHASNRIYVGVITFSPELIAQKSIEEIKEMSRDVYR